MAEQLERDLAQTLLARGVVDDASHARARALSQSEALPFDRALLKLGLVSEAKLLPELAQMLDLNFVDDASPLRLHRAHVTALTASYCQSRVLAPVIDGAGATVFLTANPLEIGLREELHFHLEEPVVLAVATTRVIRDLQSQFGIEPGSTPDVSEDRKRQDQETLRDIDADGPVIRFVSEVFDEAVSTGASDIHFESQEEGLRIRLRRYGVLQNRPVDHGLSANAVLARVKVQAGLNVSERRLPQDGRITANIAGRKIDFRVSSVPTSFGESIVARVLDPAALRLGWGKLGFDTETQSRIIETIEKPSGLFLVTGPTGSGKTTTLYTALAHLNEEGRKILTVEDPIEYNLPGIEQVQVHEEIGMTFAKALRSFLRQDPNVIMVGEIRDEETAEIACRAALVGRMVLSTLHTNSPEGAVTRLMDLGVPEYIVKDVLRGVLGQSLEIVSESERRLNARFVL